MHVLIYPYIGTVKTHTKSRIAIQYMGSEPRSEQEHEVNHHMHIVIPMRIGLKENYIIVHIGSKLAQNQEMIFVTIPTSFQSEA